MTIGEKSMNRSNGICRIIIDGNHNIWYDLTMKELKDLNTEYDKMQKEYGSKKLHSIYNGGCEHMPNLFFVFMNPTGKNVASLPDWTGIRAPWIGTKRIWELFVRVGLFDEMLYNEIKGKRPEEWTPNFAAKVYKEVADNRCFISNFAKCTQDDAKKVSDTVYKQYLPLLMDEIQITRPRKVVLFGNQVSTLFLGEKISVSKSRKKSYNRIIGNSSTKCYPVFYPVGNGYMNIDKAVEDLKWIIEETGD